MVVMPPPMLAALALPPSASTTVPWNGEFETRRLCRTRTLGTPPFNTVALLPASLALADDSTSLVFDAAARPAAGAVRLLPADTENTALSILLADLLWSLPTPTTAIDVVLLSVLPLRMTYG